MGEEQPVSPASLASTPALVASTGVGTPAFASVAAGTPLLGSAGTHTPQLQADSSVGTPNYMAAVTPPLVAAEPSRSTPPLHPGTPQPPSGTPQPQSARDTGTIATASNTESPRLSGLVSPAVVTSPVLTG